MRKTICVAVAIWFVSLLLAVPDAVIAHLKYFSRPIQVNQTLNVSASNAFCYPYLDDLGEDWRMWYEKFRTVYRFIILFACPLLIITIFYSAIAFSLLRRPHNTLNAVGGGDAAAQRQLASRRKVRLSADAHLRLAFLRTTPTASVLFSCVLHVLMRPLDGGGRSYVSSVNFFATHTLIFQSVWYPSSKFLHRSTLRQASKYSNA